MAKEAVSNDAGVKNVKQKGESRIVGMIISLPVSRIDHSAEGS